AVVTLLAPGAVGAGADSTWTVAPRMVSPVLAERIVPLTVNFAGVLVLAGGVSGVVALVDRLRIMFTPTCLYCRFVPLSSVRRMFATDSFFTARVISLWCSTSSALARNLKGLSLSIWRRASFME